MRRRTQPCACVRKDRVPDTPQAATQAGTRSEPEEEPRPKPKQEPRPAPAVRGFGTPTGGPARLQRPAHLGELGAFAGVRGCEQEDGRVPPGSWQGSTRRLAEFHQTGWQVSTPVDAIHMQAAYGLAWHSLNHRCASHLADYQLGLSRHIASYRAYRNISAHIVSYHASDGSAAGERAAQTRRLRLCGRASSSLPARHWPGVQMWGRPVALHANRRRRPPPAPRRGSGSSVHWQTLGVHSWACGV